MTEKIPLYLGPMAGFTDGAHRLLCREYGADVVCSEMISAKAVCFGDKKTESLACIDRDIRPIGLQIFGSEPPFLAKAAATLCEKYKPDFLDINMGCPVPKIVKSGDGSALMRQPKLVEAVVRAVVAAVDVPVSVKIRAGWDDEHINAPEVAKAAEAGGAFRIAVHGKTRAQFYAPSVRPAVIAAVKAAVSVPVIANGDVDCGQKAVELLKMTGCDGIMVGRAAIGAPWIFRQAREALNGEEPKAISLEERFACLFRHLALACEEKGEKMAVPAMRGHMSGYLRGLYGAAAVRDAVNREDTLAGTLSRLHAYYELLLKEDNHGRQEE